MAIIKHIPVKNKSYSAAVEYLTCKYDEHTMKPILDDKGRIVMRDNFLIEGIHCEVDTFAAECVETNRYYGKNNAIRDVKAHHYIISFSPEDNITMQEAMAFGKRYAEKYLPGHQTILAVHPDGHNGTGNVHVHIVINSLRKFEGRKECWQEKPCEYRQGCKHKSTGKFMHEVKNWVMTECISKGFQQVNLLARSGANDYWVEKRGKEADTNFKTDKDMIRERLDALIPKAESFEHMVHYLEHVENWQIRVTAKTVSFKLPHMKKAIRGKSLGEKYDKAILEERIENAVAEKEASYRETQEQLKKELQWVEERYTEVYEEPLLEKAEKLQSMAEVEIIKGEQIDEPQPIVEDKQFSEMSELWVKYICLQYEYRNNLNEITTLDYEQRHHNPGYASYLSNIAHITEKNAYINQWTKELSKRWLFQKEMKQMYKEQINAALNEVKRITEENNRILAKAACTSEAELFAKQQDYNENTRRLSELAERNQHIRRECEEVESAFVMVKIRDTDKKGFFDTAELLTSAEKKAEAFLKEMFGELVDADMLQDVCIDAESKLLLQESERMHAKRLAR